MVKEIKNLKKGLAEKIREYSSSQQEYWQQVPYLALMADGKTGFSELYSRAYCNGYWALRSSIRRGYFNVYVDLENGDLVNAYHASEESKSVPVNDARIIPLDVDELDAESIVKTLQDEAKEPYPSYYNPLEQEKWRTDKLEHLQLERIYTRGKERIYKGIEGEIIDLIREEPLSIKEIYSKLSLNNLKDRSKYLTGVMDLNDSKVLKFDNDGKLNLTIEVITK